MMIAMICVVISCVQYLVIYMIQNKVQMQDEQSYRYALMIEQGLQNGESIEQAIKLERSQINHSFQKSDGLTEQNAENTDESKTEEETKASMPFEQGKEFASDTMKMFLDSNIFKSMEEVEPDLTKTQIYVTDEYGNEVASTGSKQPDFTNPVKLDLAEEYYVYYDNDLSEDQTIEHLVDTSIQQMFKMSMEFKSMQNGRRDVWMNDVVVEEPFWFCVYLEEEGYMVYIRCMINIIRQEFVYMYIICVIAFLLIGIPVILMMCNSISEIFQQRRMIRVLYTDMATGAHNWIWFQNATARMLHISRPKKILQSIINPILVKCGKKEYGNKNYALIDLQLHRYSNYCACNGVKEGEELLTRISEYLKARLQGKAFICRHSNADFVIAVRCEGETLEECQKDCSLKVRSMLAEMTGLEAKQKLHFHAGVYMIMHTMEWQNIDIDQMFNFASYAIERGHERNSGQIFFFDEKMLEEQAWLRFIEEHMEEALEKEEFLVYLQPKYCPVDERIVGAEALVRWQNPEKGLVPPNKFIPIFEDNGFITRLDNYMISHVAKLQAEWTLQKQKQIPISVNISRAHFATDDLADHICQLVDAYGPKHELIEIEVTESAFFDDKEIMTKTVKELKQRGFQVSMDDFGAGYSSLNSLKDIPIDVLKLDGEFFRGDDTDKRGEVVVKETLQLARNLKMRVVAEGMEKKEQVDFLAENGCDMIQGYYFAKPMPIAEFQKLL